MDFVGPLDPVRVQVTGIVYVSLLLTCAPDLLKSLTAKALCDSLMELFTNIGVPSVIQGTQFTDKGISELNRLLSTI